MCMYIVQRTYILYNIDRLHSVKKREVDFNCHQCDSNPMTVGFGQDTLVRKVLVDRFWATILDLVKTLYGFWSKRIIWLLNSG